MNMQNQLSISRLLEVLTYNPSNGTFSWVSRKIRRTGGGSSAGTLTVYGYIQIRIDGKLYKAHRLAWLLATGDWPVGDIDHINGVRTDNRIENLRDVSRKVNRQNIRHGSVPNGSGHMGAIFHKKSGLFQARIRVDGKSRSLGYFKNPEDASAAYVAAKRILHEGCTI